MTLTWRAFKVVLAATVATASLLPCSLMAGPTSAPTLSIAEIITRHEQLDGKLVRTRGWLIYCQPLDCGISEDRGGLGAKISLGESKTFDRAALAHGGRVLTSDATSHPGGKPIEGRPIYIEVEGVVRKLCFDHSHEHKRNAGPITICTDRANELGHPRLIRVLEPGDQTPKKAN